MFTAIIVVHVIVSIVLVVSVLLQSGKGASIGAAFGGAGSQTLFGSAGPASFLMKITIACAVIFMATSLYMTMTAGRSSVSSVMTEMKAPAKKKKPKAAAKPEAVKKTAPEAAKKAPAAKKAATEALKPAPIVGKKKANVKKTAPAAKKTVKTRKAASKTKTKTKAKTKAKTRAGTKKKTSTKSKAAPAKKHTVKKPASTKTAPAAAPAAQ